MAFRFLLCNMMVIACRRTVSLSICYELSGVLSCVSGRSARVGSGWDPDPGAASREDCVPEVLNFDCLLHSTSWCGFL